ncbi:MAG: AgmX/PglI C-terminal domain-containing protein [bacterium]
MTPKRFRPTTLILGLAVAVCALTIGILYVVNRPSGGESAGRRGNALGGGKRRGAGRSARPRGQGPASTGEARRAVREEHERGARQRFLAALRRNAQQLVQRDGTSAGSATDARRAPHPGDGAGPAGRGESDDPPTIFPVTAQGIRGALRSRIEELKACYDGWLQEDPELGGELVVAFSIETTDQDHARVTETAIDSATMDHGHLESCVLVMVESLRFENPTQGRVTVRYPFRFAPSGK